MSKPGMRDFDKWSESIRNFEWLADAAPGGMDVDCLIERKGKFLVFEGKPWRKGVVLPWGQHRALVELAKVPNFRVFLVGEAGERIFLAEVATAPKPAYMRNSSQALWHPDSFMETTKPLMAQFVRDWWEEVTNAA